MSARLKVAVFSPLPPLRTDIANHTAGIVPALAARADVTIWTSQPDWSEATARGVTIRHLGEQTPLMDIQAQDICIYNIGNHPGFHGDIQAMARRCPGIVVLHDTSLQHFFAGLSHASRKERLSYLTMIGRHYGVRAVSEALEYFSGRSPFDDIVRRYPMTEAAIDNALAVVVHNSASLADVRRRTRLPVHYLPLSFAPRHAHAAGPKDEDRISLIVFGFISDNRRIPSVLRALAAFAQRDRFRLDIYGPISDRQHVAALVTELRLDQNVTLHGFVTEHELDAALARAHLAINLRYPTMGEASGSQLRIWSHALPSLVTRVGWYAELPEDTVFFVDVDCETDSIHRHLTSYLQNPAAFAAAGRRGQQVFAENHSPETYASGLLDIAEQRAQLHCGRGSLDLAHRVAAEALNMTGSTAAAVNLAPLGRRIADLWG